MLKKFFVLATIFILGSISSLIALDSEEKEIIILDDNLVAELHEVVTVKVVYDEWKSEEFVTLDDDSVWIVAWYEGLFMEGEELGVLHLQKEQIDPDKPYSHWLIRWHNDKEERIPFLKYGEKLYRSL